MEALTLNQLYRWKYARKLVDRKQFRKDGS